MNLHRCDQYSTRDSGHGSPPTMRVLSAGKDSCGRSFSPEEVRMEAVTAKERNIRPRSTLASRLSAGKQQAAPVERAVKISQMETSKHNRASCRTRLPGPTPKST